MSIDLEAELDTLYGLPLADFVAARNELAKRLRVSGERATATRIKKLAKPSLTAWAVNQLAFRHPAEMQELAESGAAVRAAHLAAPAEQQAAAKGRRAAISTLLRRTTTLFEEGGLAFGRQHRQRVSLTLEALSSQSPGDEQAAGRLSKDLEPQGFDALADLAAALEQAQKNRPKRVLPFEKPATSRPTLVEKPAEKEEKVTSAIEAEPSQADNEEADQAAASEQAKVEEAARAEKARRDARRRKLDLQLAQQRRSVETLEKDLAERQGEADRARDALTEAEATAKTLAEAVAEAERLAAEARRRAEAAAELIQKGQAEQEKAKIALAGAATQLGAARQEVQVLEEERRAIG